MRWFIKTETILLLKEYQDFSKKIVKIHFAFIAGENDSEESVHSICDLIEKHNLISEFNLVRYNSASSEQGKESSEEIINRNISIIEKRFF